MSNAQDILSKLREAPTQAKAALDSVDVKKVYSGFQLLLFAGALGLYLAKIQVWGMVAFVAVMLIVLERRPWEGLVILSALFLNYALLMAAFAFVPQMVTVLLVPLTLAGAMVLQLIQIGRK